MAISGLVGLPGHGKSYSAIELFIIEAAKQKRAICTNIPIKDKFLEDFPESEIIQVDLDKAKDDSSVLSELPGGALILLDELWRIWPAGLTAAKIPKEQLAFIKESRHKLSADGRETDIVLVTQDLADIASPVRTMVETTIICHKLTDLGLKNKFRRDYYRGSVKGFKGPQTSFIKSDHNCSYQESVYQYYKSYTKSEGIDLSKGGNDGVVSASIFSGLGFKMMVAFVVFLLVSIGVLFFKTKSGVEELQRSPSLKTAPAAAPGALPGQVQTAQLKPVEPEESYYRPGESHLFKLVGAVVVDQQPIVYLVSDGQRTRRLYPEDCKYKKRTLECRFNEMIVSVETGYISAPPPSPDKQLAVGADDFAIRFKTSLPHT